MRTARFMFGREFAIFKYLVAVTDHLAAFMFFLGIAFSYFARKSGNKLLSRIIYLAAILGIISGFVIFGIRMHNPKGMNLPLLAFNRKLIIFIAGAAIISSALALLNLIRAFVFKKDNFLSKIFCYTQLFVAVILVTSSLMYLIPPVIQFTREFVYFGEAGISTNAMLRALGFVIGIFVCLLLLLSSYKVHRSLETEIQKITFLFLSACAFALEFSAASISALQRLKLIPLTDNIFKIMIWRGENPNAFLYLQLALGVLMFAFVMGGLGLMGAPLWNGYLGKTLIHEAIVEHIHVLGHAAKGASGTLPFMTAGAESFMFSVCEWLFLISGGLTVSYVIKLFVALFDS